MSKRILYVEDNPRNMRLARKLLEFEGFQVLEAPCGLDGVSMAQEEKPDLILMDVNLPDIDGLEATGRIKAMPELAEVPVIALTANAMQGDKERCLAAGCDGYMSKPINRAQLLDTIEKYLAQNKKSAPAPKADSGSILVIEDNQQNARLVKKVLEKHGFTVRIAADGETGMTSAMAETPDLIMIDLGLPDMDGQTVITLLRQQEKIAHLPILAFTAWPHDTAANMANAYGFNGIISKPIDSAKLVQQIRKHLNLAYKQ